MNLHYTIPKQWFSKGKKLYPEKTYEKHLVSHALKIIDEAENFQNFLKLVINTSPSKNVLTKIQPEHFAYMSILDDVELVSQELLDSNFEIINCFPSTIVKKILDTDYQINSKVSIIEARHPSYRTKLEVFVCTKGLGFKSRLNEVVKQTHFAIQLKSFEDFENINNWLLGLGFVDDKNGGINLKANVLVVYYHKMIKGNKVRFEIIRKN